MVPVGVARADLEHMLELHAAGLLADQAGRQTTPLPERQDRHAHSPLAEIPGPWEGAFQHMGQADLWPLESERSKNQKTSEELIGPPEAGSGGGTAAEVEREAWRAALERFGTHAMLPARQLPAYAGAQTLFVRSAEPSVAAEMRNVPRLWTPVVLDAVSVHVMKLSETTG